MYLSCTFFPFLPKEVMCAHNMLFTLVLKYVYRELFFKQWRKLIPIKRIIIILRIYDKKKKIIIDHSC